MTPLACVLQMRRPCRLPWVHVVFMLTPRGGHPMELLRLLATQEEESVVVTAVYAFLHAWCRQPASVEVQISSPGRHMLVVRPTPSTTENRA